MSWTEVERDDRFRVPLLVLRCRSCRRLCVMTNPFMAPPPCSCSSAAGGNKR